MESQPTIWALRLSCPPPAGPAAAAFILGCVSCEQGAQAAALGGWTIDATEHEGKLMHPWVIAGAPASLRWLRSAERVAYSGGHYYQPFGLIRRVDAQLDELVHAGSALVSLTGPPAFAQMASVWRQIECFAACCADGSVQWGGSALAPVAVSLQAQPVPSL
jgi:hypothetical protein